MPAERADLIEINTYCLCVPEHKPEAVTDRQWAVIQWRRDGVYYKDIGQRLGVSRARAYQLALQAARSLARHGCRVPFDRCDALRSGVGCPDE